jgi:hypothetical protein
MALLPAMRDQSEPAAADDGRGWWFFLAGLLALCVALFVERASTPIPSREHYVAVLVAAGQTGRPVAEIARGLGVPARAWGRAVSRYASDPTVIDDVVRRLGLHRPARGAR